MNAQDRTVNLAADENERIEANECYVINRR